jgi:hypothetical protein
VSVCISIAARDSGFRFTQDSAGHHFSNSPVRNNET